MQHSFRIPRQTFVTLLIVILQLILSGCAVKLVADYDSAAFEEILATGKQVDKFYGTLLEAKPADRQYSKYADQYVELEADIRGMMTRNQARALNSESSEISSLILKLFVKYKNLHKENNGYSDGTAKLDRNRLARMFASAASAEEAKKLSVDDKDSEKPSK